MLSALAAELFKFLLDLVVTLFVVLGIVIRTVAFGTIPGTFLSFAFSHNSKEIKLSNNSQK